MGRKEGKEENDAAESDALNWSTMQGGPRSVAVDKKEATRQPFVDLANLVSA